MSAPPVIEEASTAYQSTARWRKGDTGLLQGPSRVGSDARAVTAPREWASTETNPCPVLSLVPECKISSSVISSWQNPRADVQTGTLQGTTTRKPLSSPLCGQGGEAGFTRHPGWGERGSCHT